MSDHVFVILEHTGKYDDKYTYPIEYTETEIEAKNMCTVLKFIADQTEIKVNSEEFQELVKIAWKEFEDKWEYASAEELEEGGYFDELNRLSKEYPEQYDYPTYSFSKVVKSNVL